MVFKRYIKRHGKKLGPYYYENIRGSGGKVKTVYVGTNPHHHPKHRIRKPLFFLILVLVLILIFGSFLFLLQNKSYIISGISREEPNFEVDQILLKVLVRQGESIENQLRVMNTGAEASSISVDVSELPDLVKPGSKSFTIKPGQTKILLLNFSSFIADENIEQQPGIYVGKLDLRSEKAAKGVPIIIEIETKNVLFDMNLNPVAIERRVKQGTDVSIEVRLFNLESIESQNVDVEYFVKDMNGNTIVTESETVVVKTQSSFFKTISIPKNLKPGPYVFAAKSKFGNSVGTSSYLFEVVGPEEASFVQFCKNSVLCLGLSLTTVLLLFALTAYFYFFLGAYLYDMVSGMKTLRRKEEGAAAEEAAAGKPGLISRLSAKAKIWEMQRELQKAKKGKLEREAEIMRLAEEKRIEMEAEKKQREIERKAREELRRKQIEEDIKRREESKREEALKKQKEEQRKKQEEERRQERLEKAGRAGEAKKQLKEFFHKIGMYKTPEEKRQVEEEKKRREREKQRKEELERLEQEKRQRELERGQEEEERRIREEVLGKQKEEEEQRKRQESAAKEKPSGKLSKFYSILPEAYTALESGDAPKLDSIYTRARDLYDRLSSGEQQQAYGKLTELYGKRNELLERLEQAEEKKRKIKAKEDKEKIRSAEKAGLAKERKEKIKEMFHKIGFYKTPEEKKQIALQKESQRKEKERKKLEEAGIRGQEERIRELERQRAEEEIKKEEESKKKIQEAEKRQREEEKKRQELERQKAERELRQRRELEEKRKQEQATKQREQEKRQKQEELRRKKIEEENSRQEALKRKEKISEQKEFEKKQKEEERKRAKEEKARPKLSEDDVLREIEGRIKAREEERKYGEKQKRLKTEEIPSGEEGKRQKEAERKKETWLGKIFRKKAPEEAAEIEDEKIKEGREVLIGELPEEDGAEKKPKAEGAEFKPAGPKSKKLEKCLKMLDGARAAISRNNAGEAKKLYLLARSLYLEMEYHEKKEIYNELMDLYNRLLK